MSSWTSSRNAKAAPALQAAAAGWPVFPVTLDGTTKKPLVNAWGEAATTDPKTIKQMFTRLEAKLIGVPCGKRTGFVAIDIDPRHGGDKWEGISRLPETRVHATMQGGQHWLFRYVEGVRNQQDGKIAPGVDVRGEGGFIVWPGSPGYSVVNDVEIAPLPDWLLPLLIKRDKAPRPAAKPTIKTDQLEVRYRGYVEKLLANVRAAPEGSKHDTLLKQARTLGGVMDAAGIGEEQAVELLLQALPDTVADWENAHQTALDGLRHGQADPIELEDRSYTPGNGKTGAFRALEDLKATLQASVSMTGDVSVLDNKSGGDETSPPPPPEPEAPEGKRKKSSLNALALTNFMRNHPSWCTALRVNLFTEALQVVDPFPPKDGGPAGYRTFYETPDLLEAMLWFQANGFPKAGKTLVWDALTASAYRNGYHPVQEYLGSLKWDGTPRLGRLFEHYFNATMPEIQDDKDGNPTQQSVADHDQHAAYLHHISQCFMVSAVARIRRPGCKVDHAPVLIGKQGLNKSKAIQTLCHDPAWFSDDLSADLTERDTKESLVGKWIIELAEIPHVRKEVNQVKAFFSRQTDRYRRAYDRRTGDWPRQCVFIGSTNDLEFIDPTGNRRWWPVEIAGAIDVGPIIADRDQLWAEALDLYQRGLKWWLPPKIEVLAAEQQSQFDEEDVWAEPLAAWIGKVEGRRFTLTEAMVGALEFLNARSISKQDQMRAAACLKGLGYKRRKKRVGNKVVALWQQR